MWKGSFIGSTFLNISGRIVMGYGLDSRSSISGRNKRFFSPSQHPDRLWGPPSLL
jgi:hypothetical protein